MTTIYAADLFAGAGGFSTGMALAIENLGLDVELTAINHWGLAVETHAANHPWAHHYCKRLEDVRPEALVKKRYLDLLCASPECVYHSNARGAGPCDDQSRSQAHMVLDWLDRLYVKNLILENVPEFVQWGPLDKKGRPIKKLRGQTFQAWLQSLEAMNYTYQWRILNCANYGDATTRRRFFLFARRKNDAGNLRGVGRIKWPTPTHHPDARPTDWLKPWKPARDIIDWSIPGHSIFLDKEWARKAKVRRPLAENTLKRIKAGIEKYWGPWAQPFLVVLNGGGWQNRARDIDLPSPTLTTGKHLGLCQPFILAHRVFNQDLVDSMDRPLRTLTTTARDISMAVPVVLQMAHSGSTQSRVLNVAKPLKTVTAGGNSFGLMQSFLMGLGQTGSHGDRTRPVQAPVGTLVTKAEQCLVRPFVVKYYGKDRGYVPVDEPMGTVTTHDTFGLVNPMLVRSGGDLYLMDILFRMLTPAELAAAHSFPDGYHFCGTKSEVVKQIGNSVPVATAKSLCEIHAA